PISTALAVFASVPVPVMISLVTSLVGGGPLGGVTCGSLDSGPLVGVFAAAVVLVLVELVVALLLAGASSALFSAPTLIVLELPEPPQPAIRAVAPSAARPRPMWRVRA